MSPNDLLHLKTSFDTALTKLPSTKQADAASRLKELYSLLSAQRISPEIQFQLLAIAKAISNSDSATAGDIMRQLIAEHWDQHKDWLRGLKILQPVLCM